MIKPALKNQVQISVPIVPNAEIAQIMYVETIEEYDPENDHECYTKMLEICDRLNGKAIASKDYAIIDQSLKCCQQEEQLIVRETQTHGCLSVVVLDLLGFDACSHGSRYAMYSFMVF